MTLRLRLSSSGTRRFARGLALWGVAVSGVLRLAELPGDGGAKVLCGPWGCLPPLQALAAAHGFWLMVIAPGVLWAAGRLSPEGLGLLGRILLAIGGFGIVTSAVFSLWKWEALTSESPWWYPVLHAVFDLAMLVDLPLVELVAAGTACVAMARARRRRAEVDESAASVAGSPLTSPSNQDHAESRRDVRPA